MNGIDKLMNASIEDVNIQDHYFVLGKQMKRKYRKPEIQKQIHDRCGIKYNGEWWKALVSFSSKSYCENFLKMINDSDYCVADGKDFEIVNDSFVNYGLKKLKLR